uniref:Setae polypeptide n=1 Tax=Ochrogaster lunifer TaxID=319761 RepID=A0AA49IM77_OCHLU|nr:setae polypeptide [Ochrogaster lunifer]
MKLLFYVFILLTSFVYVNSECCGAYTIYYSLRDNDREKCDTNIPHGYQKEAVDNDGVIGDILWKLDKRRPRCWVSVCYDGRTHPGSYCGHGPCNMFGCNCDGGCITGKPPYSMDPYKNFMDLHEDHVNRARLISEWENWVP